MEATRSVTSSAVKHNNKKSLSTMIRAYSEKSTRDKGHMVVLMDLGNGFKLMGRSRRTGVFDEDRAVSRGI